VRGRREVVLVFEVLDGERQDQRALRLSYRAELAHAQRMYFGRQFKESLEAFIDLKGRNPGDHVLEIYRARSEHLVSAGVPATWEGVEEIETR
jgi:hypothetical protein